MAERTRAVAYLRVSTDDQAEHGVSLEAQRERAAGYAKLYDLELVEVIVDAGVSAKSLEREGLQRALGMLRAGAADALLVVKLDRLTRSVRDIGTLIDGYFGAGRWSLLSVSEQVDTRSATGRMMLHLIALMAQWERETIVERTSAAMRHKVAQGEHVGGTPPYGYLVADGLLVPAAAEQDVIARARELRASGLSLRRVGVALAELGLRSRTGKSFLPAQIDRMLADVRGPRRDRPEPSDA